MRFHSQTDAFENGRVMLPKEANWLDEYIRELTTFPGSKHDDQVDSTTQALTWMRTPLPNAGIMRYYQEEYNKKMGIED